MVAARFFLWSEKSSLSIRGCPSALYKSATKTQSINTNQYQIMCLPVCFTISTSEVGVVERWGKYSGLVQPGLGLLCWPVSQLVGRLSFRVQQLNVRVETKTLDNVFLTAVVSVQYQVLRDKVYEAFYALTNPAQQITAHVYDVMRSQLPTLELDAVFEAKEELALAVKNALLQIMTSYGYQIVQVLITDLDPDQRVKV